MNKVSVFSVALKSGLILGLGLIVYSLLTYLLNVSLESTWVGYVSYAIVLLGIVLGIRNFAASNGRMTYGQGVGVGVLTGLFAGLISGIFSYLFFSFIAPEMLTEMLEMAEKGMVEQGMPDDQIEQGMEYTKMFMKPGPLAIVSVFSYAFVGLVISLIASIFLQKK